MGSDERFERSEDGLLWEPIELEEMRHRLASSYESVDLAIDAMRKGLPIHTIGAIYRLARD